MTSSLPRITNRIPICFSWSKTVTENGRVTDPKSWGEKTSGLSNTVDDFFNSGLTATQAISLSAGSKVAQTYFSFTNTSATGVMPENRLNQKCFQLTRNSELFRMIKFKFQQTLVCQTNG